MRITFTLITGYTGKNEWLFVGGFWYSSWKSLKTCLDDSPNEWLGKWDKNRRHFLERMIKRYEN